MQRQFAKLQTQGKATITFLVDRFLRVMPIYWAIIVLSLVTIGGQDLVANFTLIPLNYADFTGVKPIIFTAWSLAAEMHFYLLLPLLALCSSRTLEFIMYLSLFVFALGPFLPHNTWWSYYGIPGVLYIFLAGMLYDRGENLKMILLISFFLIVFFSFGKLMHFTIPSGQNIQVSFGVILAILIIPSLDKLKQSKWDRYIGELAFPLFLCHPWIMKVSGLSNMLILLILSLLISLMFVILVVWPVDNFRYWIRGIIGRGVN